MSASHGSQSSLAGSAWASNTSSGAVRIKPRRHSCSSLSPGSAGSIACTQHHTAPHSTKLACRAGGGRHACRYGSTQHMQRSTAGESTKQSTGKKYCVAALCGRGPLHCIYCCLIRVPCQVAVQRPVLQVDPAPAAASSCSLLKTMKPPHCTAAGRCYCCAIPCCRCGCVHVCMCLLFAVQQSLPCCCVACRAELARLRLHCCLTNSQATAHPEAAET